MKEVWKPVKGYEGMYEVSNLGTVKRIERKIKYKDGKIAHYPERALIGNKDKQGYPYVGLTRNRKTKHFKNHRLVAEAFIPNPEDKPQVNHINGIKDDNRLENLEWVTASENIQHAFDTGLSKPGTHLRCMGEKNGRSKLTESDVFFIRSNSETISRRELCERFKITSTQVSFIINRKAWKHI